MFVLWKILSVRRVTITDENSNPSVPNSCCPSRVPLFLHDPLVCHSNGFLPHPGFACFTLGCRSMHKHDHAIWWMFSEMEFNDVELLLLPKMRIKLTVISVDRIKLAGVELFPFFFSMLDFPELKKNVFHARSTTKTVNSAFKYKETLSLMPFWLSINVNFEKCSS